MKRARQILRFLVIGSTIGIGTSCLVLAFDPPALMQRDAVSAEPYLDFGWALTGALFVVAGLLCCAHWPAKRMSRRSGRLDD